MASDELLERLLPDVKNSLDITWEDEATDRKLAGFTQAGINYLDAKAGEELEYNRGSDAWALLLEFVRYARDGAMDVFENNYRHLILSLQHERRMFRAPFTLEA